MRNKVFGYSYEMKSYIIDGLMQSVSNASHGLELALYYAEKEKIVNGATLDTIRSVKERLKVVLSDIDKCPSGNCSEKVTIGDVTFNDQIQTLA